MNEQEVYRELDAAVAPFVWSQGDVDAVIAALMPVARGIVARELREVADELGSGGSSCGDYGPPGSDYRREREAIARDIGVDFQPHWPEEYAPFCDGCAAAQSADHDRGDVLERLRARADQLEANP